MPSASLVCLEGYLEATVKELKTTVLKLQVGRVLFMLEMWKESQKEKGIFPR